MYKVYGKQVCANCDKAKSLLTLKGIDFEYIDIEKDNDARVKLEWYGFRSVPQVFKGETYIGGLQSLQQSLNNA